MIKLLKSILNHFSNNKPDIIPEPVQENVPEIIKEKTFEESVAEKLDQVFNCNHNVCFRAANNESKSKATEGNVRLTIPFHRDFASLNPVNRGR